MKREPRLLFTDTELTPKLKQHVRRAEKAADKAEKAHKKIPKDKKKLKRRMIDRQNEKNTVTDKDKTKKADKTCRKSNLRFEESGLSTSSVPAVGQVKGVKALFFEDVDKPKPPSKLSHEIAAAPVRAVTGPLHQEIARSEDDNVGVESAHKLEETAEAGGRLAQHSVRSQKLKPYRAAEKAERWLEQANVNALYQKSLRDNPQLSSNPVSRWQQKRAIKKQYAAAKRAGQNAGSAKAAVKSAENSVKAAKNAKKAAADTKKIAAFVWQHKKGIAVTIGLLAALIILLNVVSSCFMLLQGGLSVIGGTTFPCADSDMVGAEATYAGMEAELQSYLDTYEANHDYDEYHYDLDEISHDPYVLIALLTAIHGGAWTMDDVGDTLDMLFERQYTLTETVTTETRRDADDEPYTYYICTVKLDNFDLSHLPVYILSEDQLSVYATYVGSYGNRQDLFPVSEYPNAIRRGEYLHYDVPPEALEDETFAAMLSEAEKFLGYPYVWGGSKPSTSFDCSGFVSWVINHSGWDVGRRGAQGLCNLCTPVTAANARPGDLVFFVGTYDTPGVSHVGIYVGNGMMIHAGDPISYANLNISYWQSHLYCYGRLP